MDERKMSAGKRRILGVLCGIGVLMFLMGLVFYMVSGADGLGSVILSATFLLSFLCAVIMLIGIVMLIVKRMKGTGRALTKKQLISSYGFLLYGASAAGICAGISVAADLIGQYETGVFLICQCMMCAGSWLCFLSGLPILRAFKK